ncbi:MAG: hypothetical protein LBS59_07810 [Puniceicoccales bacterium]|jgi:hypothetical protein|nr:hypothetical protein [Puniceicoccales bacterium]
MDNTLLFIDISGWWNDLDATARVFNVMGLVGGGVTLILLLFTIFGIDHGGIDAAPDIPTDVGVHEVSADGSLFTTRSVAAFFLGFGGIGAATYERTENVIIAGGAGFVAGIIVLYLFYFIGKHLMGLQSDGTVDYAQAIGAAGTVYVTIPPNRKSGGQVQLTFKNRNEIVAVISDTSTPLPAGTLVRVKACLQGNILLVEAQ